MIMENFLIEISEDINWRLGQLATMKTLPFRYSITEEHNKFLLKYLVPSCYAVWEGFVKNTFELYTRHLNSLSLEIEKFAIQIISHSLERTFPQLRNEVKEQRKIEQFCEEFLAVTKNNFSISSKLPTNSNVNLKTINNILCRYNLSVLPDIPYKHALNKLLHFRNSIAHGDNNLDVTKDIVFEFTETINNLMASVFLLIEAGYENKTYLRTNGST
jgi:hypothetical protein